MHRPGIGVFFAFYDTTIVEGQKYLARKHSINGAFFTVEGRAFDENRLKKIIYDCIKPRITNGIAKKVSNLLKVMRMECCEGELATR